MKMRQLTNLKIGVILLAALAGCQKLKPESVAIPEYPDFDELMKDQIERLGKVSINKKVSLGEESEFKTFEMDSALWAEELSFLKEINPNQPEYVGAFEKSTEGNYQTLTLGEGENGALKKVKYDLKEDDYGSIQATFHEDKDVYVHHREIKMNFERGLLNSIQINGYQKMMFKDTVRFGIALEVN